MIDTVIRWLACIALTINGMDGAAAIIVRLGFGEATAILIVPFVGISGFIMAAQAIKPIHRPGWLGPWFGNPKTGK